MARKKNNYPLLEGLEITTLAAEGKAMGRWNEQVVFVPMTVPGDVVDVQIRQKRRRFMEGYVVRYVKRSPLRSEPFCAHFGVCGGCKWQNLPYEEQLRFKTEQATLDNFIAEHGLKPVLAVNTHGHFDHVLGVNHLKRRYEIPFACSAKDQYLLDGAAAAGNIYGIPTADMPSIDIDLATTEELKFGQTTLQVIPTPGHTPGGVTLLNATEKVAFTGDTLFRESIGRTDLEGGDYPTLMRSILGKLLALGDEVKIFPGHAESSTIGHESMYNPFVVEALQDQINYKH